MLALGAEEHNAQIAAQAGSQDLLIGIGIIQLRVATIGRELRAKEVSSQISTPEGKEQTISCALSSSGRICRGRVQWTHLRFRTFSQSSATRGLL